MKTSEPIHRLAIRPDTADVALELALAAPPWLDPRTQKTADKDPIDKAWADVVEAFAHLQCQRTVELLRTMVAAMPPQEGVALMWEVDEQAVLWFQFDNGWQATDYELTQPDTPAQRYHGEPHHTAPAWYPRAPAETSRWAHWHMLLTHWSVSPEVYKKVDERLAEGLGTVGNRLSANTLPVLEKTLLSGKWADALEASRLAETLPPVEAPRSRSRSKRM